MVRRPFDRTRTRVGHVWIVAKPSQDADGEVAVDLYLAGEPHVFGSVLHTREPLDFSICFRPGFAFQYLDAAGRAACISATTMQDVDPGVFDRQHESASRRACRVADSLHRHV